LVATLLLGCRGVLNKHLLRIFKASFLGSNSLAARYAAPVAVGSFLWHGLRFLRAGFLLIATSIWSGLFFVHVMFSPYCSKSWLVVWGFWQSLPVVSGACRRYTGRLLDDTAAGRQGLS